MDFQMFKLDLEKAEEPEIKLPTSGGPSKKWEFQEIKTIYFCFIDYAKAFDCVVTINCVKFSNRWNARPLDLPLEKSVCRLRNHRTWHGTTDGFPIRKGVCQGFILSPYLFNLYAGYIMRNAGLEKHKLESRLPGEISVTSYMKMTPPLWQKAKKS